MAAYPKESEALVAAFLRAIEVEQVMRDSRVQCIRSDHWQLVLERMHNYFTKSFLTMLIVITQSVIMRGGIFRDV